MCDRVVTLDVGGTIFKTRAGTLAASGYFRNMFLSERWKQWPAEKALFLDRCPKRFRHVLNLLRDETYEFPEKCLSELHHFDIRWDKVTESAPDTSMKDLSVGNLILQKNATLLRIGNHLYDRSTVLAVKVDLLRCAIRGQAFGVSVRVCRQDPLSHRVAVYCPFENRDCRDQDEQQEILDKFRTLLSDDLPLRQGQCVFPNGHVFHWFYYPDRVSYEATLHAPDFLCFTYEPHAASTFNEILIPDIEWFVHYCIQKQRDVFIPKESLNACLDTN